MVSGLGYDILVMIFLLMRYFVHAQYDKPCHSLGSVTTELLVKNEKRG